MKGLVPYSASAKSDRFPHSLEFNYVSLKQILSLDSEGEYVFDWVSFGLRYGGCRC